MVRSRDPYTHSHSVSSFGLPVFIPNEIIVAIFASLDWRSLVRCSAVCRFWNRLIHETLALQYKVELGADGLVDGPPGGLSVPERLRALLARRAAWRGLSFRRCVNIPMPGECHAYELVGGVFAKAMNPEHAHGLGLAPHPGSRHLSIFKLPTTNKESETIVREDVGVSCKDFAIDPTQDLIALVEQPDDRKPAITIHLRTLSTNKTHPLSLVPVLTQGLKATFDMTELQICDDVIAVFTRIHNIPKLLIWQWTTGKMLVSELNSPSYRVVADFSLISNYAYMITCRHPQGAIKVYTFRSPNGESFTEGGSESTFEKGSKPTCTALLLPTLQPNNHYAELSAHTAPFTANVPKGSPFASSDDARIHVLSILTQPAPPPHSNSDSEVGVPPTGHAASFVVIVLNRILLKYAHAHMQRGDGANSTRPCAQIDVPWEEWGPRNSRWFHERSSHAWLRYVHGPRLVRAVHSAWPNTRCRLQVLDFHVHPLRLGDDDRAREMADAAEPDVPFVHRLIVGPTLMRDRSVFKGGGVESRLPYREVTLKKELGPYSGFMIDEERIIGLSPLAFANGDMKRVDVFTL